MGLFGRYQDRNRLTQDTHGQHNIAAESFALITYLRDSFHRSVYGANGEKETHHCHLQELEDGSVSHSNTSQGHALQEEEEESDTPQELPSPHTGSVSGGGARALACALQEEEEEEGDTP